MNINIPMAWSTWRSSTAMRRGLRWWLVVSLAIKLLIIGAALFSAARSPGQNSSLFHHDLPAGRSRAAALE